MKSEIQSSNTILVATDRYTDYDKIVATISLAKALSASDKEVSVLMPDTKYVKEVLNLFDSKDIKRVNQTKGEGVVLSFKTGGAPVENIKWQEKNGEIYIYIDSKKVELAKNEINVQQRVEQFDLIVLVGVPNLEALGDFYKSNKDIFSKEKIVQLGYPSNDLGSHKLAEDSNCISELVLRLLEAWEVDISKEVSTNLLAGLLWKTDGLKKVSATLASSSLQTLLSKQADLTTASQKAFDLLKPKDIKLVQQILKNLQIIEDKIAYSIIKKSQLKEVDFEQLISPSWFFIDRLQGISMSFVLIEFDERVVGIISSKDPSISAVKVASQFGASGDSQWAQFYTDDPSDEVKEKLLGQAPIKQKQAKEEDKVKQSEKIEEKKQEEKVKDQEEVSDPLSPAKEPPQPLKLGNGDEETEQRGGFTPPPPINPLPPAAGE